MPEKAAFFDFFQRFIASPCEISGLRVEGEASVAREPLAHIQMLLSGVIPEDHMDDFAGGNLAFDGVEEANELLMPGTLHVAANHRAVEDVERGEQRQAMRLKPVRAPDALKGTDADADGLAHHRAGPMRRLGRRV